MAAGDPTPGSAAAPAGESGTAFWSSTIQDPKRGYRWLIYIGGFGADTATWHSKKVSKPSFTITETAHTFLNHKFYYPGRVEWNTVTVTLVDPVSPDAAANTAAIIAAAGYVVPSQKPGEGNVGTTTIGKSAAVSAIKNVTIVQIDSAGNALETWRLKNPWIKDVKFGDLDYEADELTMIDLEIRYDWATLETSVPSDAGSAMANTSQFWSTEG